MQEYYGRLRSEADLYPVEWLFLGGMQGTLPEKLTTVRAEQPSSAALFMWKLHNAVTSSVDYGKDCRTLEAEDLELYRCIQGQVPPMGRAWPFACRFEYWLADGPQGDHGKRSRWHDAREHAEVIAALSKVRALDSPSVRAQFWSTNQTREDSATLNQVHALMQALEDLDTAFLSTGVLQAEYRVVDGSVGQIQCGAALRGVDEFEAFQGPDFQWQPAPASCASFLKH